MTDRPIIMSGPMVRALLDGRKTQTRRLASSPLNKTEPGDLLWVRETWCRGLGDNLIWYAAGETMRNIETGRETDGWTSLNPKRPSIHMPRKASRLTLLVKWTRVEWLQDITEEDARAEGMGEPYLGDGDPPYTEMATMISRRMQYRNLWNQLHPKPQWDDDPEVVVLEFEVLRENIDRVKQ